MEYKEMTAKLNRKSEEVSLTVTDGKTTFTSVILTDHKTDDIRKLFDELFEYIIDNEKSISIMYEKSEKSDIFDEVANEVLEEINKELKESEDKISELVRLKNSFTLVETIY